MYLIQLVEAELTKYQTGAERLMKYAEIVRMLYMLSVGDDNEIESMMQDIESGQVKGTVDSIRDLFPSPQARKEFTQLCKDLSKLSEKHVAAEKRHKEAHVHEGNREAMVNQYTRQVCSKNVISKICSTQWQV